jgi:uncharacterized protein YoxC
MAKKEEEKELKSLWNKVNELEVLISKNITQDQQEAASASRKASEYRNKTEQSKNTANEYLEEIEAIKSKFKVYEKQTDERLTNLISLCEDVQGRHETINDELQEIEELKQSLVEKVSALDAYFIENQDIEGEIDKLTELNLKAIEEAAKINQVLKNIVGRKSEIDELYFEILGYDETNEDDESKTHVDGLKDELEAAYEKLTESIDKTKKDLRVYEDNSAKNFDIIKINWEKRYKELEKEIQDLLPNALTAGLSAAYSEKKDLEVIDLKKLERSFRKAIGGLVGVSLIPFASATAQLIQKASLEETILSLPRVILSILPLYIPVLWLAYSSNKKMNLSKRLIEEYTHKEVLSKTFEGLSNQIEGIPNKEMSGELKIKLLYNLLNVSAENPGKLISDYNKSDHPIMDALDKSSKLSDAVDKLEKIPGFKKVAKILDERSKKIIEKETTKVEEILETVIESGIVD